MLNKDIFVTRDIFALKYIHLRQDIFDIHPRVSHFYILSDLTAKFNTNKSDLTKEYARNTQQKNQRLSTLLDQ